MLQGMLACEVAWPTPIPIWPQWPPRETAQTPAGSKFRGKRTANPWPAPQRPTWRVA